MTEPGWLGHAHFWIGCLALFAGFAALVARKGGVAHRSAGATFALTMALLSLSGLWLSLAREIVFTVILSIIAFHCIATGWMAARGDAKPWAMLGRVSPVGSALATAGALLGGLAAAAAPNGELSGLPPGAFFVLAAAGAALLATDVRYAVRSTPEPRRRIARHLWRMGFAFFLATGIFFFGNNHVLPEALRTPWLLAAPVIAVVGWTLFYAARNRFGARPILLKRSA